MNRFIFYLYKILSFSPLFTVSDDNRYGEVLRESSNFRKSLVSFKIGIKAFYIVTFNHINKFNWIHTINLYDVQNYEENIEINGNEYDAYKIELDMKGEDNILSEREFINHRISEVVNVKNKIFNKFLAYVAIFAFLLPLFTPKIMDLWTYVKLYKLIFILSIAYIFLNVFFLFFAFIRVKGFNRTTFKNIRDSETPVRELNALLFYEWKNLQNESVFEVAVIKNLEKYIASIILWGMLIIACINVEGAIKANNTVDNTSNYVQNHSEVIIFQSETNFNSLLKNNDVNINRITDGILNKEYKTVVIVSKDNNKLSDRLLKLFELYNNGNTSIIEIKNKDYTDQIEVIVLEK